MRLVLHLDCDINSSLPINYNYQLGSAIYNLLRFGSPEFSDFLHDIGYQLDGKHYKLFSFAFRFDKAEIIDGEFHFRSSRSTLHITSPMIEPFIKNFVIGTFEKKLLILTAKEKFTKFRINSVEITPEPTFTNKMKFSLYSPMVLSTVRENEGKKQQYYLRPEDKDELNRVLTKNLLNKKGLLNRDQRIDQFCSVEWDSNYIQRKHRITKKITINENGRYPIDIIGIQAPFTIEGDPELIKVGYECGFGEKNSMGFGLAEEIKN